MEKSSFSYIEKLKRDALNLSVLVLILYVIVIITVYKYYSDQFSIEKTQILQKYYKQILKVSTNKLNLITAYISSNLQDKNIVIDHDDSNIEICSDTKCKRYNLYKFKALLNSRIPEFIYYRIELNGKLLCSNTKNKNYTINRIEQLNKANLLNISLKIDNDFLQKLESDIKKPFWIFTIFSSILILLLYILSIILSRVFNKIHQKSYKEKYSTELKQLEIEYQNKLQSVETIWKKEIWDNEFNRQKANQIALINNTCDQDEGMIKDNKLEKHNDIVPCSIILYQSQKIEEIYVTQLVELFTNRFKQDDKNITIKIEGLVKVINFSSSEALYQIIYSIIKYLYFLIKKQSSANRYEIQLVINTVEKKTFLHFEYNGCSIETEVNFLQLSHSFYKTHANPFLLNPEQIFNLLKANKLNYKIGYNNINFIEIQLNNNGEHECKVNDNNNVIMLNSFSKKTKDLI